MTTPRKKMPVADEEIAEYTIEDVVEPIVISADDDPPTVQSVEGSAIDFDAIDDAVASAGARARQPAKRGRKTKADLERENAELSGKLAEVAAKKSQQFNEDSVKTLSATLAWAASVGFGLIARARGPHWKLEDDEAKTFGAAWSVVAAQYAEQLNKGLPWLMAIGATYEIVNSRVERDNALRAATGTPNPPTAEAGGDHGT